jgi:hypothetical protein
MARGLGAAQEGRQWPSREGGGPVRRAASGALLPGFPAAETRPSRATGHRARPDGPQASPRVPPAQEARGADQGAPTAIGRPGQFPAL